MGNKLSYGAGTNHLERHPEYGKVTKLFREVTKTNIAGIKLLMLAGADPNVKFKRRFGDTCSAQWSAIHEACRCQNESQ